MLSSTPSIEPLEQRTLLSVSFYEDVNKEAPPIDADPGVRLGGQLIFPLDTPEHGKEIWTTDGTRKGTRLLKDVHPGYVASHPAHLTRLRKSVLFGAYDNTGPALFRTDGTPKGTRLVRRLDAPINNAVVHDGNLYFTTRKAESESLWRTDGTESGTHHLKNVTAGEDRITLSKPFLYKRQLRFIVNDFGARSSAIWTINERRGQSPTVTRTTTLDHLAFNSKVLGGWIYYVNDDTAIARTNLRDKQIIKDITPDDADDNSVWTTFLHRFGDAILFTADDGVHGVELWKTDGTPAGTSLLKDVEPGDTSSFGANHPYFKLGNEIYFTAGLGPALWKSDGTADGTVQVHPKLDYVEDLTRRGDHLYSFARRSILKEKHYYRTDGTTKGTVRVDPPATARQQRLGSVNGVTIYSGPEGVADSASLRAFDSANDDDPVRLLPSETRSANPHNLTPHGDDLYFATTYNVDAQQNFFHPIEYAIWKKSGDKPAQRLSTLSGTVAGIYPARDLVFFTVFVTDWVHSSHHIAEGVSELWVTDGTPKGTRSLTRHPTTLTTGHGPPWPTRLALAGNTLFYYTGQAGFIGEPPTQESIGQLWTADGTTGQTRKILDVKVVEIKPAPDGDAVFFIDGDGSVWRTGGTNTRRLYDAAGEPLPASNLNPVGDGLFFTTFRPSFPHEQHELDLWFSDGRSNNARKLQTFDWEVGEDDLPADFKAAPAGDRLVFNARILGTGYEPWTSDGTAKGTRLLKDIMPGGNGSWIQSIVGAGDLAYFAANDDAHGIELWRTDGTPDGTTLVADLNPGPDHSNPRDLTAIAPDRVAFLKNDPDANAHVWIADPQGAKDLGTVGPYDPNERRNWRPVLERFVLHNGNLVFPFPHPRLGRELWQADL